MRAVFDTNILVDYLNGRPEAREELRLYKALAISIITWMEVLVGVQSPEEDAKVRVFLRRFERLGLGEEIAAEAIELRRQHRLNLPDAVIWASARQTQSLFVTRNTKDFPARDPGVRVPYTL